MYSSLKRFSKMRRIAAISALLFVAGTAIIIMVSDRKSQYAVSLRESTPMLVIDAGHGGLDGGAVSSAGDRESCINLAIAHKLRDLCCFMGLHCTMTRSGEALDYPAEAKSIHAKKTWDQKRRAALINAAENAVLISIHQNYYPDPRPSGTQVLYAGTEGSQVFAELTHDNLRRILCPDNRRVPVPAADSIYLLKSIHCPAILVECGFLSNLAESEKLTAPDCQTEIAVILCTSYLQFISPNN